MKVLYYDCFCGISGDMNLAALLDAGVDEAYVRQELSKLNLDAEFSLVVQKGLKKGISGTRVEVKLTQHQEQHQEHHQKEQHGDKEHSHHIHSHAHANGIHTHAHTHHHHEHSHQAHRAEPERAGHQQQGHHHAHRNLQDIEQMILGSDLSDAVKKRSIDIFMQVAAAEAKVHGKPLQEVHFHEVGAIDSIVDIVGAAICLEYLQVDLIMASPVQLGGGFVQCAHGIIPIPAPATLEILKQVPVKTGLVPFETTTPTGAAILAANVVSFTDELNFTIEKIGYGLGQRELDVPNVLRVYLGQAEPLGKPRDERETQYMLETNIDDMNPEFYGYVEDKLFAAGALDVFKTAITMKKGRAATKLSVLVNGQQEEAVLGVIFRETTSIGLRKYPVDKIMLPREFITVTTKYGEVTVKHAYYQGETVKYKPEYEDCRKLAELHQVPLAWIYHAVYKKVEEMNHEQSDKI